MVSPLDYLGAPIESIDTPALLIELDIMTSNLQRMATFLESCQAALRPHAKTHKCAELALEQIKYGAIGITCAKLGEAEALVAGGLRDILIAKVSLSEEHGKLEVNGSTELRVGDKFELLPSHCCTTINLHDFFYCHRKGIVESVWSIAGRGKFQ